MRHFPSLALSLSFHVCGLASYPSLWFNRVSGAAFCSPGCSLCRRKGTITLRPLNSPHSESTFVSFITLNAVQQRHSEHKVLCSIIIIAHGRAPPPDPPYTFSLAETFIKSFLESRQSVTYSTRPFHSNLHLFTEYLFLLGIEVLTRVIFQLFHWANNWHSKVPSENKVKKDWVFRD